MAIYNAWEILIAVGLAIALGLGAAAVGLPYAVGYVVAGAILSALGAISQFSFSLLLELGMGLALFYLGTELSVSRFKRTGIVSGALGLGHVIIAFALGFAASTLFGFNLLESVAVGIALSMSSTIVITRLLQSRGALHSGEGQIAYGALLVQDLVGVIALAFFSAIGARPLATALFASVALVAVAALAVRFVTRAAHDFLDSIGLERVILLVALAQGAIITLAAMFAGITPLVGAFFAGFALSQTHYGEKVRREGGYLREVFTLLLFVSIGALAIPSLALTPLTLAILVCAILANLIAYWLLGSALGLPSTSSVKVGLSLLPLGELAIILAVIVSAMNIECNGVCPMPRAPEMLSSFVLVFLITSVASALLAKRADAIAKRFASLPFIKQFSPLHSLASGFEKEFFGRSESQEHSVVIALDLVKNLLLLCAIAYLGELARQSVSGLGLPLPGDLTIGFVVLLAGTWPAYNLLSSARLLAEGASKALLSEFSTRSHHELHDSSARVFAGLVLCAIGIVAMALLWPFGQFFVVAALCYTILALAYTVQSAKALARGGAALKEGPPAKNVITLMFEREHLRDRLGLAMRSGDGRGAKSLFTQLKHKDEKILRAMTHDKKRSVTRKDLENYLFKQAR